MGTPTHKGIDGPGGLGDTADAHSGVHPVQRLQSGERIGDKYIVRGTLGVGGFAVVYDAEHEGLGKAVAIKVMHLDADTPFGLVERFRQEARISALLRHPNVLDVYDTGSLADGSPYLVMERIEGETLYRRMTRRGLSIPAIVEVARQVLAALSVLAERDIVHRDIKPENIMLHTPGPGLTVVKILDFGISKIARDTASSLKRDHDGYRTCNGAMIGTPHYMSPEQIRGESVDSRSDLYALGVVLYEALTGLVPFDGSSLNALVLAALNDDVRPIYEGRPDCPAELERIVRRAMARDREERYDRPADMLADLERLADALRMPQGQEVWFDPPWKRQSARLRSEEGWTAAHGKPVLRVVPSVEVAAKPQPSQASPYHRHLESVREELTELAPSIAPRPRQKSQIWRMLAFSAVVIVGLWEPKATSPATSLIGANLQNGVGSARASAMFTAKEDPPVLHAAPPPRATTPDAAAPKASTAQKAQPRPATKSKNTAAASPRKEAKSSLSRGPKASRNAQESRLMREAFTAYLHGDLEQAYGLYRRAAHEFPDAAEGWRGLGLVATRLGHFDEARRALGRYLSLAPAAVDAAAIAEHRSKLP